jgi:MFS family permease
MFTALDEKTERRNIFHLYADICWMTFAFAMEWYYLQVYAIRLGATPLQMGWITSGRALLLAVGTGLTTWWCGRQTNRVRAIALPLLIGRALLYGAIVFVPFLPFAPTNQVDLLVALVCLSSIPIGVSQGAYLAMLPTAVSKEKLARVVANRSIMMNALILVCMVVVGQMLEWLPKPDNYQVGFAISFAVSVISWLHIQCIKTPETVKVTHETRKVNVWASRAFRNYALVFTAINASVFMISSIVNLQLVRALNASDAWISLFGICEMAAGALLMLRMDWLIRKFGTRRLIIATTFATLFQPLVLGLTPILHPYIFAELLFGGGWFAVNVLMYNQLVEIVPPEDMTQYAAAYQLIINVSLFIGPLLGTFLIENVMTLPATLLLIAAVRIVAGFLTWGIKLTPIEKSESVMAQPVSASGK